MKRSMKCVVKGCENHKNEGGFEDGICLPCYLFITTGEGIYSQAYRNARSGKNLSKAVEIIKDFQSDDVPPCKYYEDTYADGWMDACNEILWAIEEELGKDGK